MAAAVQPLPESVPLLTHASDTAPYDLAFTVTMSHDGAGGGESGSGGAGSEVRLVVASPQCSGVLRRERAQL